MTLRTLLAALAILITAQAANGHIVQEAPWHPIAYAYRSAIFLLNLEPVKWRLIEQKLETDDGGAVTGASALERLQQIDGRTPSLAEQVRAALDHEDPAALFETLTRATSKAIRHHLQRAAEALDEPGRAALEVAAARSIFRAFGDGIQQTDPEGFKKLGLAWLDLSSSIGHPGLASLGPRQSDLDLFEQAKATIDDYLERNFEPASFAARQVYGPVPEQIYLRDPEARLAAMLPPGSDINDQDPLPRLVLNFEQRGIDESDLFLVAFGDMLFDSPELFGDPARSLGLACSTCHNRSDINQRFFIPGITPRPGIIDVDGAFFNARFNDHRDDAIDIPSLRGVRFTAPYGRDGRFASLRDFTRNVIVGEFAGEEPSPLILDALVAYMLEFDFLPASYLNADGTLNAQASEAARRGEALFRRPFAGMQERSCASCHVPDSHFTDGQPHIIGSAEPGYPGALDAAYDTPTLLGSVHTAPYFHNGSLESLAEVVAWFDERFELGLTETERGDLTAYLEAVGAGHEPYETFDDENTPFRLMVSELGVFLSTLDTLIPARDRDHALLLLRTVAADMAADASAMSNRAAVTKVYEMAERLRSLQAAIEADDWIRAASLWTDYRDAAAALEPELF